MAHEWNTLRGLTGTADACTCSDAQLTHVGCDCDAGQNLPVQCCHCHRYLRSEREIAAMLCINCAAQAIIDHGNQRPN